MTEEVNKQEFEFPATTEVLADIGDHVARAGGHAGFDDGEIGDIQLAVDEACTNTITHGLNCDPSRTFQMEIWWKKHEIEILIRETGKPFNPFSVKGPDIHAPLEDRPVGGLGVFFIKKIMDRIEYRISENGVKTVRMTKRKLCNHESQG